MKCEHCGKNEVTFIYQSSVNGTVTEKHLCSACAEKLGYSQKLAAHSQRMMRGFDEMFGGSFLDGFFEPLPGIFGRMNRMLENPLDDFFAEMPVLGAAEETKPQEKPKEEPLVDAEAQGRFARMRKLNALRLEMKKAVRQEEFERAAELRDEIRKLEDTKESA